MSLRKFLVENGLRLWHSGKVRDIYELPDDLLLVVATDRISVFDFVLNTEVPHKGEVLVATTIMNLTEVLNVKNHMVAFGSSIDLHLPTSVRGNKQLQRRALVVKKLTMMPYECIARGYLTGNGWSKYEASGVVWGTKLPEGLHDGSKIPEPFFPMFTPTTKEKEGHDVPVSPDRVISEYGDWTRSHTIDYYSTIATFSKLRGIIFADTKFEFSIDGILADEVGTPDSSRSWDVKDWERYAEQKKSPPPYDKELVRQWARNNIVMQTNEGSVAIPKLDPKNPEHVAFVRSVHVPADILSTTTHRYCELLQRLTDMDLATFQQSKMGITSI